MADAACARADTTRHPLDLGRSRPQLLYVTQRLDVRGGGERHILDLVTHVSSLASVELVNLIGTPTTARFHTIEHRASQLLDWIETGTEPIYG